LAGGGAAGPECAGSGGGVDFGCGTTLAGGGSERVSTGMTRVGTVSEAFGGNAPAPGAGRAMPLGALAA